MWLVAWNMPSGNVAVMWLVAWNMPSGNVAVMWLVARNLPSGNVAVMWLVARNLHHDELPDLSCRRGKIESRDADNFSKSLEKSF
jgi:hypothetical protein